jgi:hypothetical protein
VLLVTQTPVLKQYKNKNRSFPPFAWVSSRFTREVTTRAAHPLGLRSHPTASRPATAPLRLQVAPCPTEGALLPGIHPPWPGSMLPFLPVSLDKHARMNRTEPGESNHRGFGNRTELAESNRTRGIEPGEDGMPRVCSICQREDREKIEGRIRGGESLRVIAEQLGMGRVSLIRHRAHHMASLGHPEGSVSAPATVRSVRRKVQRPKATRTIVDQPTAVPAVREPFRSLNTLAEVEAKVAPLAAQRREDDHHGSRCPVHPFAPPIPYGHGEMRCGMQKAGCKTIWRVS